MVWVRYGLVLVVVAEVLVVGMGLASGDVRGCGGASRQGE